MRQRYYLVTVLLTSLVVGALMAVSGAVTAISQPGSPSRLALELSTGTPAALPPVVDPRTAAAQPDSGLTLPFEFLEPLPALDPFYTYVPPEEPGLDLDADVNVDTEGFFSWAALDRESGRTAGSDNLDETSSTESTIKAWLVADLLRTRAEADQEPSERELEDARLAIRDSHNGAAERLYQEGGSNDVVERMIEMCGLTDTEVYPYWWSRTEISARDTVRLGECLANGTAAGPEWTDWLLEEMRNVRGSTAPEDQPMSNGGEGGDWGIVDGLPESVREDGVAVKNGWTAIGRTNSWHVSCLAITDDWVISVLMRYPVSESLDYGAQRCAEVAEQLVREPAPAESGTGAPLPLPASR